MPQNTVYPIREEITGEAALRRALSFDHVCAKYKDDRRSEANFLFADVLPMDCDNDHSEDPADWKTPEDVKNAFPGAAFAVAYSRSHMKPKHGRAARPKFHVYFPIRLVSSAKQYAAMKMAVYGRFPWFDGNALDAARFYFGSENNMAFAVEGEKTVDALLEGLAAQAGFSVLPAKELPKAGMIPRGERNSRLSALAGRLVKRFGDTAEAEREFLREAERCVPPLDKRELASIWKSAVGYGAREAAKPGYIPPEEYNREDGLSEFLIAAHPERNRDYAWTDIGAGRLFADCFRESARYVPEKKSWYVYEGGVWAPDGAGLFTMERCKRLADALTEYTRRIEDIRFRQEYLKFCSKWQRRSYRETVLKDAQSVYPVRFAEFDADPEVLNCKNGTLRLDTMEFKPHSPGDMLTKMADADYDPAAVSERFSSFISEIMCGDEERAAFLQKAFGYAAGGDTRYECLFILYGAKTRNGKGTLCESVLKTLGSYACASNPDTIGLSGARQGGGPSEDVARLAGVRFANISEPPKGLVLNAALVKSMTGSDTINARFLHENSFDFKPQFKLYINTNYRPTVNDLTLFASERVVVIPFDRHFADGEQDKGLKTFFAEPACRSAILNWLIEGRRRLREEGLAAPASVRAAIGEYRHESDKTAQFVEEALEATLHSEIKTSDAYALYRRWCEENGCRPENSRNFVQTLRTLGEVVKKRPEGGGDPASFLIGWRIR